MNQYLNDIKFILKSEYGKSVENASKQEIYQALSKTLMVSLTDQWEASSKTYAKGKQAFYLSAEFLMGRALGNNLLNLGKTKEVASLLDELGLNLNDIEEIEEDAGLGNGGLGRLAACFLDSAASTRVPLIGYGIRNDYGIFIQLI